MLSLRDANKIPEIARGWAQQYGEIVHTRIGAAHYIWLNSPRAVRELMDKRGSIYSDRPHMPMAFDAVSNQRRQFFMPYGDRWRAVRRVSHAALNLTAATSYLPVQDFESKQVLHELLHATDDWQFYDINRRYSSSVIITITYGQRIKDMQDPLYRKIYTVLDHFTAMAEPGRWLVDTFPSLAALPSWLVQNWWTIGRKWHAYDSGVYLDLYNTLIEQVKAGTAPDCFVKDFYLSNPEARGIDAETAAYTAGSMVEAGSESTSTAINTFLLACLLYPHIVAPAQAELDRVVGPDRIPDFADEPNLPYIAALARETLRWRPITKLGAPHATSQDDWYDGYFIPKGSMVVLSWWAIHFDQAHWAAPHEFNPLRYMQEPYTSMSTAEAMNTAHPDSRDHYAFGAGRRSCSGVHVAQNSLFITIARTLWGFNVSKARDNVSGTVLEPDTATENGFLAIPKRFPCRMRARSARHAEVMEGAWERAQREGVAWSRRKTTI
ncbi:cytochrome P450 [Aspergillus carlsbadensis]|nr:cytochrome P450 [Aspergillus carlsbadensis]